MTLFNKLKKRDTPHALEISMAGVKRGSKILQIYGQDASLISTLAGIVGLSGRACAVVADQEQVAVFEQAASTAGVFVEITASPLPTLPYDQGSFDVVFVKDVLRQLQQNKRVACVQQMYRLLRPGGRCLVIEKLTRGGLGALFSKQVLDKQYEILGGAQGSLKAEGFLCVRILADRDGISFTEGTRTATD
jgi:ubiquinone/menaquinone biosynthesis C-methylase UbiE